MFIDDDRSYGDANANDTSGWRELELSGLAPSDGRDIPIRLLVNRFESSSPHSEAFIHDPLGEIIKVKGSVPAFANVTDDWHVSTFVINHHRTLSVKHVYPIAVVSEEESTIGVTIYKHRP